MPASASVDIEGKEELQQVLEELPGTVRGALAKAMTNSAFEGRNKAISKLTKEQSGFQEGNLRSTIGIRKRPQPKDLEGIVAAGGKETSEDSFDYALAVEFGSKPHFPPVKALTGRTEGLDIWVRRMDPSPQTDEQQDMTQEELNEQVAFLIAKEKIAKKGTEEMPFMRPASKTAEKDLKRRLKKMDIEP